MSEVKHYTSQPLPVTFMCMRMVYTHISARPLQISADFQPALFQYCSDLSSRSSWRDKSNSNGLPVCNLKASWAQPKIVHSSKNLANESLSLVQNQGFYLLHFPIRRPVIVIFICPCCGMSVKITPSSRSPL